MGKKVDHGLTATHIYGTGGLIAGFIGLAVSIKGASDIYAWLLFASGWLVAAFLTWFLISTSKKLTAIIEQHDEETSKSATKAAMLEARVSDLQKEVDRRHATLDYLSSLLITGPAIPRRASTKESYRDDIEGKE